MADDKWDLSKWDWKALGLRSGVEIHQQLRTERKLFCRCPAGLYSDRYDAQVLRHMRPTLSELGEYDGTALMEFKTKKEIIYLLDTRSVCTYEMDDTPPFEINRQAIDIVIEICIALGCSMVGEIHVARKQYLDGSIPAGFQRTAIVGVDGGFAFSGRRIRVVQVSVEEDACREVSDVGHRVTFRTDRLSMPLTEIVTGPDFRTPEEVARGVRLLADVMRLTGRVRTGAGATREDVNVSVEGGTRVEIKGVPSISFIPALVGYEGLRQHFLLEMMKEARDLGVHEDPGFGRAALVTEHVRRYGAEGAIGKAVAEGAAVGAVRLPGYRKILATEIGPGRTFLDEIRGRVRVIACLDVQPIVAPLDDWRAHGLHGETIRRIRRFFKSHEQDGLVMVWGPERDVITAMEEIRIRAREASRGVPNETRQVKRGGITDFERILPGPDRMYPDTDSPPLAVPDEWLDRIRALVKDCYWDREEALRKAGVPEHKVRAIAGSPRYQQFMELVGKLGASPITAAWLFTEVLAHLERRGVPVSAIHGERFGELFELLQAGRLAREAVVPVVEALAREPGATVAQALDGLGIRIASRDWVETQAGEVLSAEEKPGSRLGEARERFYMGRLMKRIRGSFPGRDAREILARRLGEAGLA